MGEIDMGIYNRLFPYYIEACAVTQYHKRGAKPGGWGGHATIFMNGAEIDPGAGYPRLRLASPGADRSSADSGVGVSVNQIFTNVNWVAVPGRLEFFRGGLAAEQITVTDLYANLTHFRDRYSRALATPSGTDNDTFEGRFCERLEEELERTESLMAESRLLARLGPS